MGEDFTFLASEYESIQSEDVIFSIPMRLLAMRHVSARVCCVWNDLKVWQNVILSRLVYDAQFSLCNYLQSRQVKPSVLKSVLILSHDVYSGLQ